MICRIVELQGHSIYLFFEALVSRDSFENIFQPVSPALPCQYSKR